jgi:hypothetical protein
MTTVGIIKNLRSFHSKRSSFMEKPQYVTKAKHMAMSSNGGSQKFAPSDMIAPTIIKTGITCRVI